MSSTIKRKINFIFKLIKDAKLAFLWNAFLRRLYSEDVAFGFKRELDKEQIKPRVLLPFNTRPCKNSDIDFFLDNENDGLINDFETCYVATTKEGVPCFRLWVIGASQNKKLKDIWGRTFPQLLQDEVLIENVFTVPKFRGMGILPAVLYDVCETCKEHGAKYALTFGLASNNNTSRSYHYAGFYPYVLRKRKWFLFRKSITFEEIPKELMEKYNKLTRRKLKSQN